MKKFKFMAVLAMLMTALIVNMSSCTTVDSGSVGIRFKKWSSNVEEQGGVMGTCSGFVWFNPFTQSIYEYETFVQRKNYEGFKVNAKDASVFTMEPTIAYRLNRNMVEHVFVKYRKPLAEIEDGYIRTCIYDAYRNCANMYTADYLMGHRGEFESEVRAKLDSTLTAEGFIVEEFTSNIIPPQSLQNAINAKNEAVQNALKADNQVKEAEAKARIEIAKAEGEAKDLKIKADGEAYYNKTVAASLTPTLVQQYALEK